MWHLLQIAPVSFSPDLARECVFRLDDHLLPRFYRESGLVVRTYGVAELALIRQGQFFQSLLAFKRVCFT